MPNEDLNYVAANDAIGSASGRRMRECPLSSEGESLETDSLVCAWRSQIRFSSGALAEIKDLEFMYAFNVGGTLTESSNYGGAPPVPPASRVWKKSGLHQPYA